MHSKIHRPPFPFRRNRFPPYRAVKRYYTFQQQLLSSYLSKYVLPIEIFEEPNKSPKIGALDSFAG